MRSNSFWYGKKVLITGHTGFKGSWLSLWLLSKGAHVAGYALDMDTEPNLFSTLGVSSEMLSICGDIRDRAALNKALQEFQPEIVFHLAAQPLVRKSYNDPIETFNTNIIGTANLLDVIRKSNFVRVIVNVTSDKCYENKEQLWGYRETDSMGGYDPYSCSKGCAELITDSFRRSFFLEKGINIASARAGNVVGGGDWGEDRLVPDIIRAVYMNCPLEIRNPMAIRPWQYVLEPLNGYLILAEKMWNKGEEYASGWNFGPNEGNIITVSSLLDQFSAHGGCLGDVLCKKNEAAFSQFYETQILRLDSSKAKMKLGWYPKLDIGKTLKWTWDWYQAFYSNEDMKFFSLNQIDCYERYRRADNE